MNIYITIQQALLQCTIARSELVAVWVQAPASNLERLKQLLWENLTVEPNVANYQQMADSSGVENGCFCSEATVLFGTHIQWLNL